MRLHGRDLPFGDGVTVLVADGVDTLDPAVDPVVDPATPLALHDAYTGVHSHSHAHLGEDHSHAHFHNGNAVHTRHGHGASLDDRGPVLAEMRDSLGLPTPTTGPLDHLSEARRREVDGANEVTEPGALASMVASAFAARGGEAAWVALREAAGLTAAIGSDGSVVGSPWHAYACVEGIRTDDGRELLVGSTHYPDMPISIRLVVSDEGGHWGAVTAGRVDTCAPVEAQGHPFTYSTGCFGTDENGQLAELMVAEQTQRFISIDPRDVEAEWVEVTINVGGDYDCDDTAVVDSWLRVSSFTLGAMTIVAMPALQMCCITLADVALPDSPIAIENAPPSIPAMLASAAPLHPPAAWFADPVLDEPTPLTVTEDGRVFGHIACWSAEHNGFPGGRVRPPRSHSGYAHFLTGEVETAEGTTSPVGQITMGTGHASTSLDAAAARAHYDLGYGAVAMADVTAGDDAHGIWVAGALRPGATDEQIREFRALAPSGDWRRLGGHLELVAVLQVAVPGFVTPRALAASGATIIDISPRMGMRDGVPMSLVAAGRLVVEPVEHRMERMERAMAEMRETLHTWVVRSLRSAM